jgi:hypothetical protein
VGRAWSDMVDQAAREAWELEERFLDAQNARARQLRQARELFADISPYGQQSRYSFFADLALVSHRGEPSAKERLNRELAGRERLLKEQPELRAVLSGTLGGIVPGGSGMPAWTAEAVAAAVRSAAPLASALLRIPLPPEGNSVQFGKFSAGTTGAVQNPEASSITEGGGTAPAVAFDSEPFSTIATWIGVSFQAVDRSGGEVDQQIAADVGAAYGSKLEAELFVGTGSSGRIRGLNAASWGTTKTVAAQTLADFLLKFHDAFQSATVALGMPPDLAVFHPRRLAILQAQSGNVRLAEILPSNLQIIASPAASSNLGGGTNEDWTFLINRDSTPLVTDPPSVEAQVQGGSGGALQVNYVIHGYSAFASARRPEGLAVVKGATTPTF